MVKVKVCGITQLQHAKAAEETGADAIGFVFAESKRMITTETARKISKELSPSVKKVGVFVDAAKDEIERIVDLAGIDFVQLHGNETPEFCHSLSVPCYKAISIQRQSDLNEVGRYTGNYILLDSGHGSSKGGNGTSFDWNYLRNFTADKKIILAGGLNVENIERAVREVNPFMVDVSSGVETDGAKDPEKIKKFIFMAKNAIRTKEELR
ncbi:phosphoribosylanthranilate isomerase [Bacillus sp. AK031]